MKLRGAVLLIPLLFAFSALGSDAEPSSTPTLMDKTLVLLHLKHRPRPHGQGQLHDGMELQMNITPDPINLNADREVKATVDIYNRTKKFINLDFPTSQRIEVLVKDATGKVITTWSEDQSFTSDPATVTVNPGERLEYSALVATREMSDGHPYIIEASFPSYPDLKVQKQVVPGKE